ncbi:DNA-binding protein [Alicyclobacillaceae bacterium I2511]|nr:DNA-binding protein [Alicyclobacillaceae bacterium I2511]
MTVSENPRMIDKVTRMGRLCDLYGPMLMARQQEMLELHYFEDWSLSEMATYYRISRQAVHDYLQRAEVQLEMYEDGMGLLEKQKQWDALMTRLQVSWSAVRQTVSDLDCLAMEEIVREMSRWSLTEGRDGDAGKSV